MAASLHFVRDGVDRNVECGRMFTIGRSKSNDLVLADDKVSRSHVIIRQLADGNHYIIDVGSANGTLVNGERVIMPTQLNDSDELSIGGTAFSFQREPDDFDEEFDDATQTMTSTVSISPVIKHVAVLVADIRGYTKLSEHVPIAVLAKLLGRWFKAVNDVVEENRGVVDKFIGDAVLARWLVEDTTVEAIVFRALRAADGLNRVTRQLSGDFEQLDDPLYIGVGINVGKAAVGVMGAGRLQDHTVLGDSVNIAFRLETGTKELKTDLLISREACIVLPQEFWKGRECSVPAKNKEEPTLR